MPNKQAHIQTWGERMLGEYAPIISLGVSLTALGSANGTFLTAGRLSGVAVKDGNMPEVSSWIHVRSKTNLLTLISRAVIASMMIIVGSIGSLVRFFIFTVWMFHGLSVLALLVLRYKNKEKKRPYKVNIVIPIVVVLTIATFTVSPFLSFPKPEFIASLVLLAMSLLLYYRKKLLPVNPYWSEKLTIMLQLFLRVSPRSALRVSRKFSEAAHRASMAVARRQSEAFSRRHYLDHGRRQTTALVFDTGIQRSASSVSAHRRHSHVYRRRSTALKRSQTCATMTTSSPVHQERDTNSLHPFQEEYNNAKPYTNDLEVEVDSENDSAGSSSDSSSEEVNKVDFRIGMLSLFSGNNNNSSSESSSEDNQYESISLSSNDEEDDFSEEDLGNTDNLSFILLEEIPASNSDDQPFVYATKL